MNTSILDFVKFAFIETVSAGDMFTPLTSHLLR